MKILLALSLVAITAMAHEPGTQKAETFKKEIKEEISYNYLAFVPKGYSDGKKWPLMIFLHGAGERGTDINKVTVHGPPKIAKTNPEFPFVLISPQCASGQRWEKDKVMALLDHAISKYNVDTNRIYLTGISMGGYGTWDIASTYPERFAAIVPICGGGQTIDLKLSSREKRKAFENLGIWAFTGAKDQVVPVEESQRMVDAFKSAGAKDVQFTIYPEANHDSWTETYNNPKVFEWFLKHTR